MKTFRDARAVRTAARAVCGCHGVRRLAREGLRHQLRPRRAPGRGHGRRVRAGSRGPSPTARRTAGATAWATWACTTGAARPSCSRDWWSDENELHHHVFIAPHRRRLATWPPTATPRPRGLIACGVGPQGHLPRARGLDAPRPAQPRRRSRPGRLSCRPSWTAWPKAASVSASPPRSGARRTFPELGGGLHVWKKASGPRGLSPAPPCDPPRIIARLTRIHHAHTIFPTTSSTA